MIYWQNMIELLRDYLALLFGETNPLIKNARTRKRLQQQRQQIAITLIQIVSILAVILLSVAAHAQESEPRFRFDRPSDEMDFNLPPVPSMPSELPDDTSDNQLYDFDSPPPPPLGAQDDQNIDQFFSTTTIVSPDREPSEEMTIGEEAEALREEEKPKPAPKKKSRAPRVDSAFVGYAKPPHRFKSVTLPEAIYHKDYSKDNKYLPLSYTQADQQHALEDAITRNDVDAIRALYRNGAALDAVTDQNVPYVVLATQANAVDALRFLLMYQADAEATDAQGLTAYDYAQRMASPAMLELLRMYGPERML